jgi:CHASE2 domain-containing sensor protein/predicted Ser/Thr protein kinase
MACFLSQYGWTSDNVNMDVALMDDILAKLAGGTAADEELLEAARWALAEPDRLARFRAHWPTSQLPVVNDYYCVAALGQGASGVVFKALALRREPRFVALKLLQFNSRETEGRFREREIEILKTLRNPHVARHLDSGTSGGTMYLAMELVDGWPLHEYLAEHTNTLEEKLAVFQCLCEVVAGMHAEGVIHRDLKPRHVLVDRHGQPWIVDFGISAVRGEDWPTRVRRAQTELGHILGTIKYMSPEQAWGGLLRVDQRADIWSLGIMLYEIATEGGYPYDLDPIGDLSGHDALLHRIQTEMPRPPRIVAPQYAEALTTLISRCLAHDPQRRITSATALADDLGRCLSRQTIRTRRLPWGYRLQRIAVGLAAHWRTGLWASTVGAVLLFLFIVSVAFGVRWRVTGTDYGETTRRALAAPGGPGDAGIVIVGISDESLRLVPELAHRMGIPRVMNNLKSWRAVYGYVMERLARAHPRAVLWDFYFPTPQPEDVAFVRGVQALHGVGVPVVLAVRQLDSNGLPALSPQLSEPLADIVHAGIILSRDLVRREGELVIALHRGNENHPSLALAAFAAMLHPDCKMTLEWQPPSNTHLVLDRRDADLVLWLTYRPRTAEGECPGVDRLELTIFVPAGAGDPGTLPGDVLLCKACDLERPDHWEQRTIPYERLLTASDAELAGWVGGKIVLFGDLRRGMDRHRVRYGTEVLDDVPGCYPHADALRSLLANRSLTAGGPASAVLAGLTFVGVVLAAFLACLLPPKVAVRTWFTSSSSVRTGTLVLLSVGSLSCTAALILSRSRVAVHAAMLGTAICLALAASFAIEFTRNRYRLPANR